MGHDHLRDTSLTYLFITAPFHYNNLLIINIYIYIFDLLHHASSSPSLSPRYCSAFAVEVGALLAERDFFLFSNIILITDAPHKSNASSKQWGTILAKETFQLDASLQRHAQNVDPTPFVGDIRRGTVASRRIEHGQLDRDPDVELVGNGEAPTKTRPTLKSKLNYKEFLEFCTSVSNMPTKYVEERVSRLFLLIRVGEIAIFVRAYSTTERSGD